MDDGLSPQEVLAELARLLEGLRGEAIVRLERSGAEHRWRVHASEVKSSGTRLSEMEQTILQAACEHTEEVLTGEELAKLAGYEPSARFRRALAHLRQLHLLTGKAGEVGYQATEPAHDYVE